MKKAIFLYDYTGLMAQPWLDAGYECWCFDGQHEQGIVRDGLHVKVGMWLHPTSAEAIKLIVGDGVAAELLPKVSDYLNLVTALILAFGLCFQLPVVMTLLGMAGLINSKVMAKSRRYAIVAVVVVAAVVTPPDPISQLMLAVPMVLLYEVSIWCVRIIEMRRKKDDALEAEAA